MKPRLGWLAVVFFLAGGVPGLGPRETAAQEKKHVVEEIVARVNNEIVTLSDLERARATLLKEAQEDCRGCTPAQLQEYLKDKQKNLLRDLIDQSLLAQRGKDLGLNVEPDVVKTLDRIRQQNNLSSMEELEKAVVASGTGFEEFKAGIRNHLLTQQVIQREVVRNIIIGRDEMEKYYNEHKNEFVRPEQVFLREIFVSTEGKSEQEIPALEQKAKNLLQRVRNGEEFTELAKRFSDGSTAQQGGELGMFERGQLSKEIEDVVFKMKRSEVTDPIPTKTGFLILKVEMRYEAGLQPVDKVEGEISNRIYGERVQPALRVYLKRLREESYVLVKAGYVDADAAEGTPIVEVQPAPEETKGNKKAKKKKENE